MKKEKKGEATQQSVRGRRPAEALPKGAKTRGKTPTSTWSTADEQKKSGTWGQKKKKARNVPAAPENWDGHQTLRTPQKEEKLTSLTPGTDSTVRAAWFPT